MDERSGPQRDQEADHHSQDARYQIAGDDGQSGLSAMLPEPLRRANGIDHQAAGRDVVLKDLKDAMIDAGQSNEDAQRGSYDSGGADVPHFDRLCR